MSDEIAGMTPALVGPVRNKAVLPFYDSTMSRNTSAGLAIFAMLTSAVACSEQVTSPKSRHAPIGAPSLDIIVNRMSVDSTSADFTVTPTGGTFIMGPHAIHFPANSICDPVTSSYGVSEWDAPCTPLTSDIEIHAEVRSQNGFAYVDFSPALRFTPSANGSNYVWLLMKSETAKTADIRAMNIFWTPAFGSEKINEAVNDTSLRTYVWQSGGVVFRRVKHFSAFVIIEGDSAAPVLVNPSDVSPVNY